MISFDKYQWCVGDYRFEVMVLVRSVILNAMCEKFTSYRKYGFCLLSGPSLIGHGKILFGMPKHMKQFINV